ncbi:MAG: uracil-DNA glycosylase [Bacillota bacterium]
MKDKPGVIQRSLFGGESLPGQGTLFGDPNSAADQAVGRCVEQEMLLEHMGPTVEEPCRDLQEGLFHQGREKPFHEVREDIHHDVESELPAQDRLAEIDNLVVLRQTVLECRRCGLRQGARGAVFGEGNPAADIMFVGEGPGQREDELGRPFVGRAGQLLDLMLRSHGFSREEVFIANIVKCRPPGNRLPAPQEVEACLPNLEAQIRIIRPKIIVTLGALASQTLIDPGLRVTRDRGKWFQKDGVSYLTTFHPAAVLRDERNKKRLIWEDFASLRQKYTRLYGGKDTD